MLPDIPTEIGKYDRFPYPEGKYFEFKKSCRITNKILPTLCAFLNSEGGHLVFGVTDAVYEICGLDVSSKEVDDFILTHIDSIFQYNRLIYQDTKLCIDPKYISTRIVERSTNNFLVIVTAYKCDEPVQVNDGSIYHRLNASNLRVRNDKVYFEEDMSMLMAAQKRSIVKEYTAVVRAFTTEVRNQSKIINKLHTTNKNMENILYSRILSEKENAEKEMELNKMSCMDKIISYFKNETK